MIVLLTNDDGYGAPGLEALRAAVATLPDVEVWMVAPAGHCSGCGHSATTTQAVTIEARGERDFAIGGTPVDCARIALTHLVPQAEWVISGINAGGNLGCDVLHSGTVAAARESVFLGARAVAVSHYLRRQVPVDWEAAAKRTARVLVELFARHAPIASLWNVNLPHLDPGSPEPELIDCPLDPAPLPVAFEVIEGRARYCGDYQKRERRPGADIDLCFGGAISVSRLDVIQMLGGTAWTFSGRG